jgi:hypothetical protein
MPSRASESVAGRIAHKWRPPSARRRPGLRCLPKLTALEERTLPSVRLLAAPFHMSPAKTGIARPPQSVVVSSHVIQPATLASLQIGTEAAAVTVGTAFRGVGLQDLYNQGLGVIPPDTMGAAGPNQFVEMINGQFAIFSKTGIKLASESLDQFWAPASELGTTDPHIVYDHLSGRWFASALDLGTLFGVDNNLLFAVSKTSNPAGPWTEYRVHAGSATSFADFDTLGVDTNGVYFGANIFSATSFFPTAAIYATRKVPLLSGGAVTVFTFSNITDMEASPQPALNFDPVGPSDPAWFVSSSNFVFANVEYKTLTWKNNTPTLSSTGRVGTPLYSPGVDAPALGGLGLDTGDDRLLMSVIRNKRLYTARTVGVGSIGNATGDDRDAAEFVELDVSTRTATLVQTGREFDPAAVNPRSFFYPSIAVNGLGYLVMGFSGSSATQYVGAYATARLASDPAGKLQTPTLLKAGEGAYSLTFGAGFNRWGDYSYTSVDPADDKTIWTIQEYAAAPGSFVGDSTSRWGTWIDRIVAPKTSSAATVVAALPPPSASTPGEPTVRSADASSQKFAGLSASPGAPNLSGLAPVAVDNVFAATPATRPLKVLAASKPLLRDAGLDWLSSEL